MDRTIPNVGLALALALGGGYAFHASGTDGLEFWDAIVGAALTSVVVVNVLRRPAAVEHDTRWWVWLVCAASVCYFLAFRPEDREPTRWQQPAYYGMLLGHVLGGVGCALLGASFSVLPARRRVCAGRLYRYVRHPVYAAYLAGDGCFVALVPSAWNALVWATGAVLFAWRAHLEERLLAHDPDYLEYRSRTRWRLLPGVY